ncbi:MAG: ATP-binding protein [Amaricoccus sp.]
MIEADGRMDEGERDGMMRLSQRLVALHVAGIAILVVVVLSSVAWISREHNLLALHSSESLVEGGLDAFRARLRTLVNDYSVWDEAYDAARADDRGWLYSNIGNAAAEIGTLDLIVFVAPDTGASFGWRRGSPTEGEPDLLPPGLLAPIERAMADPDQDHGTVMASYRSEPWVFSAARVRPVDGAPAGVPEAMLPIQVHGMRLSGDRLAMIGHGILVNGLSLADAPAPGKAKVALVDFAGRSIGYITWVPPRPGASILGRVAPPLGLALLLVTVVSAISSRYAVRSARRLECALLAAKAADRSKTEFLSNVSHELRTPMNGVLGVAQLLQTTQLDDEQRELVAVLFASANAQMALISDLLDFSKLEGGNRQLVVEPFEPASVLRDVAEMMRVAADGKLITLDCSWEPLAVLTVMGDPHAFRQIVTNLVGNAVKFTDEGGVTLAARVEQVEDAVEIAVAVEDSGRGIPADALPHIFERFYQVDASLSRTAEGTGLGLAISQNLARMMGGRIDVASRLGLGSAFTFTARFPTVEAPEETRDAA